MGESFLELSPENLVTHLMAMRCYKKRDAHLE